MLELQKREFKEYFEKFDTKDENIIRKYNHSIRVMNLAVGIAQSMNFKENAIELI